MKNKPDNHDQKQTTEPAESAENTESTLGSENTESTETPETPETTASQPRESQETPQQTEVDSPQQEAAVSQAPEEKTQSPSAWPGRTALVLALAALGLSGYLFMQQQELQNQTLSLSAEVDTRLANNATEVARTVTSVSEQAASVNQQLGQLKEQTATAQREVDNLHERLTQSMQQVQAQQTITEKDWLLAEAEYLLRLANQRILMEQNASGALALLRSADEVLLKADDAALYQVREALAQDISTLESVPRVDTEGVFLKLSALSSQVANLQMTPITDRQNLPGLIEEMTPEAVRDTWGAGAREALSGAMQKFEQLVVIQHRDEPVQPLLSPEQNYFLQQNLHLMFEQAQHALLQRRQAAYDKSLEKSAEWIQSYFLADDSTTQAMLESIESLKQIQVAVEVPSINGSLSSLQQHINELRRLKREGGQG